MRSERASDPERLINASSVFDNLWLLECHVWRMKWKIYPCENVQIQDVAQTGSPKDRVVCFSALISCSNICLGL